MVDSINILYGKNDFLVKKKLKEKISQTLVEEINIVEYDMIESSTEDVIEDLRTVSFFSEKKVVIVNNIEEVSKMSEAQIKEWVRYIEHPNPDTYLFIVMGELINESTLLGKTLFQKAYIEGVADLAKNDYPNYINSYLKKHNFQIAEPALKELLTRTNYDLSLIIQELNKLMLYNFEKMIIEIDSVVSLVSRNLEENIYELTNNLLSHNTNKTIEIYYDLIAKSEDPIRIMNNIINKIRELIHTKILLENGYSQEDIEKHFNIKSGLAYYLIKNANQASLSILEDYLTKLSKLDLDIKSGKIDKEIGLEIFILGAQR